MTLWSLIKLHESVRVTAWHNGFTYFPETIYPGSTIMLFEVKQLFTLSHEAHDIKLDNHFCMNKPQRFLLNVSHVGQTSFTIVMDWFDGRDIKMGSFSSKICQVSLESRKPIPLQDFFYKNLDEHFEKYPVAPLPRSECQHKTIGVFSLKTKALHSDCDQNNHVNHTVYLKWCSDAGTAGAINGYFKQFKTHIESYTVKSFEMDYIGESLVNDELLTNVWESEKEHNCLMYSVEKKGKEIFKMKMTFYESDLKKDQEQC